MRARTSLLAAVIAAAASTVAALPVIESQEPLSLALDIDDLLRMLAAPMTSSTYKDLSISNVQAPSATPQTPNEVKATFEKQERQLYVQTGRSKPEKWRSRDPEKARIARKKSQLREESSSGLQQQWSLPPGASLGSPSNKLQTISQTLWSSGSGFVPRNTAVLEQAGLMQLMRKARGTRTESVFHSYLRPMETGFASSQDLDVMAQGSTLAGPTQSNEILSGLSNPNDWATQQEHASPLYPPGFSNFHKEDGEDPILNLSTPREGSRLQPVPDAPQAGINAGLERPPAKRGRKRLNDDNLSPEQKAQRELYRNRRNYYHERNKHDPNYKLQNRLSNRKYLSNPVKHAQHLETLKAYRERQRMAGPSSQTPPTSR